MVQDIRAYTLQILYKEINNSIHEKFGTDWGFTPQKVCEMNGRNLIIEGQLNQEKGNGEQVIKKIRVDFSRSETSKYKVVEVNEL
ncbi:hypothetical protein JCM10914A_45380 [Paenibacillus sp. JCM 10914]|nr:hypothetical protein JCM10914_5501 [Paenibacillus sp. JCM 10914]